ncbi:hypothetical protein Pcinc_023633 [Petrolisthes cinctipes]|uniref:Uncharacterized protein n=1 Tax=Petrolisthes cinctipes TaxID=88211 RepID=A0AAE1KFI8_PETCI|nr:hypothetical protein Pcinc_023633 [Petrolisthes cinctipes]
MKPVQSYVITYCEDDSHCSLPWQYCVQPSGVCQCKMGTVWDPAGACEQIRRMGEDCKIDEQCTSYHPTLVCKNGRLHSPTTPFDTRRSINRSSRVVAKRNQYNSLCVDSLNGTSAAYDDNDSRNRDSATYTRDRNSASFVHYSDTSDARNANSAPPENIKNGNSATYDDRNGNSATYDNVRNGNSASYDVKKNSARALTDSDPHTTCSFPSPHTEDSRSSSRSSSGSSYSSILTRTLRYNISTATDSITDLTATPYNYHDYNYMHSSNHSQYHNNNNHSYYHRNNHPQYHNSNHSYYHSSNHPYYHNNHEETDYDHTRY